eukprot:2653331-Ditylum_brightwellii.AAC.1
MADKFDAVQGKIVCFISVKFTYGTEIKSAIDKLQAIPMPKPSEPANTSAQIDNGIYKEEAQEYAREKKAIKKGTKQAYAHV